MSMCTVFPCVLPIYCYGVIICMLSMLNLLEMSIVNSLHTTGDEFSIGGIPKNVGGARFVVS